MGIDYGLKRTGLAVTDPLQIIASPLETVRTHTLIPYLSSYCQTEPVDAFVVGLPKKLDNSDTHITQAVRTFVRLLKVKFPEQQVHLHDERFTSKMGVGSNDCGGHYQEVSTNERKHRQSECHHYSTVLPSSNFMIYPIVLYGDPILKKRGDDVTPGSTDVKQLSEDMFETMYQANGIGLAAPQIGLSLRMFVVDSSPIDEEEGREGFKRVFINPEVIESSGDVLEL